MRDQPATTDDLDKLVTEDNDNGRPTLGWLSIIQWTIVIAVAVALTWTVWKSWNQLAEQPIVWSEFRWPYLLVAMFCYGCTMSLASVVWRQILLSLGCRINFVEAFRAFVYSQLAKYIPGKAMVIVVRCMLVCGNPKKVSKPVGPVVASSFIETMMFILVGAQLGCVGIYFLPAIPSEVRWTAIVVLVIFGLLTLPPVFAQLTSLASRLKRKSQSSASVFRLKWTTYMLAWGLATCAWVFNGAAMWFVLAALQPKEIVVSDYFLALTTISLATVAGFASMLPGGLGVRELVMIPLLVPRFSITTAVAAAIFSRLIGVVAEVAIAAIIKLSSRRAEVIPDQQV